MNFGHTANTDIKLRFTLVKNKLPLLLIVLHYMGWNCLHLPIYRIQINEMKFF